MTERDLFKIEYTLEKDIQVFDFITLIKYGILENKAGNYTKARDVVFRSFPNVANRMADDAHTVRPIGYHTLFLSQLALSLKAGFLVKYPMREDIANDVLEFVLAIAINRSNDELLDEVGSDRESSVIYLSEALDGLNQMQFEVAE